MPHAFAAVVIQKQLPFQRQRAPVVTAHGRAADDVCYLRRMHGGSLISFERLALLLWPGFAEHPFRCSHAHEWGDT